MAGASETIDDYLEATRASGIGRGLSEEQGRLMRRAFAQQLARSATQQIDDRRKRALVKVEVYNHLVPLLDHHWETTRGQLRFYRKLVLALAAGLAASLALIALLLAG